ncbi:MAG: exonuclease domain-containing protein [Actinomycetota bacterium]|nr:exonuclease domain-containing protein [Actinomycetota bacterium]
MLDQPLAGTEFLVVDVETNGRPGEACELTEVGAVLVGGGELHERWETLVGVREPLSHAIQRFTGITQPMVDAAPPAEIALAALAAQLEGRVLVAHSAAFDRRVLRQAFAREELDWPDPPALCTVALARRFAPLVRQRRLRLLAEALGVEVEATHRALADAETCARVLCALLPRLAAHAATVGDAVALLRAPRRARTPRAGRTLEGAGRRDPAAGRHHPGPAGPLPAGLADLPGDPGVYLFRNAEGQVLYVGKSVALRARARAHFQPSAAPEGWTAQAATVDHRATHSELGALVLENRLIKELHPPGNLRLKHVDAYVYLRCRLDIAFPVLEVATDPAPGHAVTVGPLRGRRAAVELMEQLNSLFGLRHCGRTLRLREHPSAYGQMGRCLSPCLNDLDPNLYRRRLDAALGLFCGEGDGAGALLAHVRAQMQAAAAERQFERAAWLRRRLRRLETLVERLAGVLQATHARPRLVLAAHPRGERLDAFWIVAGRLAAWAALPPGDEVGELERRTAHALRGGDGRGATTHVPAGAVDELRIVSTWLASHDPPSLDLTGGAGREALAALVAEAGVAGRAAAPAPAAAA